jgi:hypothetical protein
MSAKIKDVRSKKMFNIFRADLSPVRFLTKITGYHLVVHLLVSIFCPIFYAMNTNQGL